jgi:hypothetical protein
MFSVVAGKSPRARINPVSFTACAGVLWLSLSTTSSRLLRQVVEELDRTRVPVRGHLFLAEPDQFFLGDRRIGLT